jgi:isopentenyl-diphosphate delta-isomerase
MSQDDQIILAVDENGEFKGEYIPKWVGHTGKGQRHLAITVQLINSKGELLIQRRKHRVFDDVWDMTASTHPLHNPDGTDETVEDASWRSLEREYQISEKMPLKNYGFFDYFATYGELCENEHCAMLVGEYNGDFKLNEEVGYGYKWMSKKEFIEDVEKNPNNYSPWTVAGAKVLKEAGFFNS